MTKYEELQLEHQRLLEKREAKRGSQELLQAVQAYIERARVRAGDISSPRDRDQLRANLRFWASFVYEKTGTYPETALRPALAASLPTIPAPWHKQWWVWAMVAGCALFFFTFVLILGTLLGWWKLSAGTITLTNTPLPILLTLPPTNTPLPPTDTPTPGGQTIYIVQSGDSLYSIALRYGVSVQSITDANQIADVSDIKIGQSLIIPLPTLKTPRPTNTLVITCTPTTIELTSTPGPPRPTHTPTPYNPPSPTATLPPASGGGIYLRTQLEATVSTQPHPQGCAARVIDITFDSGKLTSVAELAQTTVQISRAGSGEIITPPQEISSEGTSLNLSRYAPSGQEAFLVRVNHPLLTASSVIVQFTGDCKSNWVKINYEARQAISSLAKEPARNPNLSLDWRLIAWGPSPFGSSWVAVLALQAEGGDGNYVFWADGQPLADNRITLQGNACAPARKLVGVSSGGQAVLQEMVLAPPCP